MGQQLLINTSEVALNDYDDVWPSSADEEEEDERHGTAAREKKTNKVGGYKAGNDDHASRETEEAEERPGDCLDMSRLWLSN